ncbi:MAG: GNAT family N-acetyltransferase [Burkholderiales bacterium]
MSSMLLRDLTLRGYKAGDIGRITLSHANYYQLNWQFDASFEAARAKELADFIEGFNKKSDGLWVSEYEGEFVGSIAVDGKESETTDARLRWFIVEPEWQGKGIGQKLIEQALAFCRKQGYKKIVLWTFAGLDPARVIYERAGFRLVEATPRKIWGRSITEQKFELTLS